MEKRAPEVSPDEEKVWTVEGHMERTTPEVSPDPPPSTSFRSSSSSSSSSPFSSFRADFDFSGYPPQSELEEVPSFRWLPDGLRPADTDHSSRADHSWSPPLPRAVVISIERMKQKMVIRVRMEDAKKRSKALKIAVGLPGVTSAAIEGVDKNLIVVIGDGVDLVSLAKLLRKRIGLAEIVGVSTADEKVGSTTAWGWPTYGGYTPQYYNVVDRYQDSFCGIM